MKRSISIGTMIGVLIIALAGCTQPGYLEVENDTGEVIWVSIDGADEEELDDRDTLTESWDLESSPIAVGEQEVEIAVRGVYKQIEEDTVTVTAGETEPYNVVADGGAIRVNNNSSYNLYGIYITSSSASTWGSNLLASALPPGYYFRYYGLAPGSWDVRLADASYTYNTYNWTVSTATTRQINFVDQAASVFGASQAKDRRIDEGEAPPIDRFEILPIE